MDSRLLIHLINLLSSHPLKCSFFKILEELQKDPWPAPADQRSARSTGTALSIAAHLLGLCVPGSGARIMAFLGGPSTEGPGSVSLFMQFCLFCRM